MINKKFQMTLIAKFLAVNIMVLLIFGVLLYMFLNSELEANLYSAHVTYHNIKEMLFPIVITLSALNIFISSTFITIFVLYASFRIAGPLYRFDAAIKEINQGNLSPLLVLREKDELCACSESLQDMTKSLISMTEKGRSISTDLQSINESLKNDQLAEKINEINSILNGIKYKK